MGVLSGGWTKPSEKYQVIIPINSLDWDGMFPTNFIHGFFQFQRNNPFSNQTFAHLGVGVVKAGRFDVGKEGIRYDTRGCPGGTKKTKREGDFLSRKNNPTYQSMLI